MYIQLEVVMKKIIFLLCFNLVVSYGFAMEDARILRMPDINKDLVVFVYAGDIWIVSANGGEAKRLTSHEGLEIFPKISPDGKWIAFSGEYSGSRQVYVVSVKGGTPKQLTFYNDVGMMPPRGGFDYITLDWTNDSQKILVRANRTPYGRRMGKYFLIDINGGLERPLQIPEAGTGTFSPDQKSIVYTPISREFRTWKRTKGGRAQDVWIYNLEKDISERITKFVGTDQHPIWFKNKIYFISDRDLTLNFFSYDLKTKRFQKITEHTEFDVLWPSGHNGLIVYENGGYIYKLDLLNGQSVKLKITINFDNPNILPYFKNVKRYISRFGYNISPTGKRAVFDARGDLFTVPAKKGITYNLTRTPGIREMYPVWSPDGKWIAYYSDKTGDYELYIMDPKTKKTQQITEGHKIWKAPVEWSPDSKLIFFRDINRTLQIVDISTKQRTVVDKGKYSDIRSISWSADSKWLIYTKTGSNKLDNIWVYSIIDKQPKKLLKDEFDNSSAVFSKCGKYVYFLSLRDFNMDTFSSFEFDFVYNKASRIYAAALTPSSPKLFKEENDMEEPKKSEGKPKESADKKKKGKKPVVKKATPQVNIDFKGIDNRVVAFPLATGRYNMVYDLGGKVLYFKEGGLYIFDMKKKKSDLVIKGIRGGAISSDNKKFLYRARDQWGIVDIKPNQKVGSGTLKLDDVTIKIYPKKEWKQIYNEGWRIFRDWFYVGNMHGVDWLKMKKKYSQLVPHVSHRADLDYIFGELVGELNAGHTYVNWGDFKAIKRLDTGLLGIEMEADPKAGRYKITKIYQGENWNERTRSPLTDQGVAVKEGDYIIELNGFDVTLKDNPYQFLENTAGKKIEIKVSPTGSATAARSYIIKPTRSELGLRYLDWVNSRRAMVDKLSGGKIGYIHVPDTAIQGNRELFKGIYSQSHKQALIIDERYNGGGWSPGKMIEKLSQKTISYWHRRGLVPRSEPTFAIDGPLAMLINHLSSSGGDNFPYWFRKRKLGPLIGTRTWGGLIGYGWSPGLVDGPSFAVPMSGIMSTDGEFIVEGVGVYPDEGYEVYDRPEEIVKGKDPCIEVAVKYLLEELKKNPVKRIYKSPKEPDRSKWFEKEIK
jgi:tricorn protease